MSVSPTVKNRRKAEVLSAIDKRGLARWYPLIPHPVQLALVNDPVRFKLVPAGRRSGKTERAKRKIVKSAWLMPGGLFFVAAPTREQAKKIYWRDLKLMSFASSNWCTPSESNLSLHFANGSIIQLVGLDKPERFEGPPWDGGIIDEIANVKESAWYENIRPALDTFDPSKQTRETWAWLIGVPEGLNHYYDLCQYAENSNDPEWGVYAWPSSDILSKSVIAAAKRQLSARQFRQEYEASFETVAGRIYDDYGVSNHVSEQIQPHEQLHWTHDQNFTPLSSAIAVVREGNVYFLDEIVLTSAVSKQAAQEFVEKYKGHENKHVKIYGDPAGRAGEKHGHASDYTDIENVLRKHGWTYERRVKNKAPAIKDRQNATRAKICSADGKCTLFVNPVSAPWTDKGLSTVQLMKGSTFQEDQKNQYQHITTAVGYFVDRLWPVDSDSLHSQVLSL